MPTARSYGARRVTRNQLPNVRATAAETPTSRGAGLARTQIDSAQEISRVGATVAGIGLDAYAKEKAEERQRADEVALLAAENSISRWTQQRLYDPENGALARRGKDAFDLPETVAAEYEQLAGDIAKGLTTDRQRMAFAKARAGHAINLDLTLRRHVFGEMQRYEAGELNARVENGINTAVQNALEPARVAEELQHVVDAIERHGPRSGLGPEAVTAQKLKATSAVHVGVIDRLLSTDNDRAAKEYFEETKAQIDGGAIARIEKALEEGSLRGESQRRADEIVAAGGSLAEWRAEAKKIDDPEVRDAVMQRVEDEGRLKAAERRAESEASLRSAYDIVDKTGSWRKIPPTLWTSLDGSDRSALRSYAKAMAEGGGAAAIKTDYGTLYNLLTLSSTDEAAFLQTNLLKHRGQLSNADLEQMMRLQATMRTPKKGAGENLFVSERAQNDMVDEALTRFGLPRTPGELAKIPGAQERVNAFRRSVREAVTRHEQQTGKKATDSDVQGVVDTLAAQTGQRLVEDRWIRSDIYAPTFAFETAQAKVSRVEEVPAGERRKIEAALARAGVRVTPAMVVDLFNQNLARVRGDR